MSAKSGAASQALSSVFKEQAALLRDFAGLVLTLLYESSQATGQHWHYVCSLPLHVPLREIMCTSCNKHIQVANKQAVLPTHSVCCALCALVFMYVLLSAPTLYEKMPQIFSTWDLASLLYLDYSEDKFTRTRSSKHLTCLISTFFSCSLSDVSARGFFFCSWFPRFEDCLHQ
jgi:hypothetical protein